MKIKIFKDDLIEGTQIVQNAISTHTTLPILSNILIEAKKDRLYLTSTDLDIGISSSVSAKVDTEGAITVPAKKFSDIIRELSGNEVEITAKKNNSVDIKAGRAYFKLMGIDKDEFPKLPDFKDKEFITLKQSLFRKMMEKSAFAISKDETRYILNGVLVQIEEGSIRMVATDGRRLVLIEESQEFPKKIDKQVIIPQKTIQELIRNLTSQEELKIIFDENQVCFEFDNTIITSRLIEGEFPDYEKIIPQTAKDKVVVDRDELYRAIKRVSLFTNADSQAIKIDILKNRMILSKSAPELGEAKDELKTEYEGKPLSIGFNPAYLTDFLKVYENEKVEFELTDPEKPGAVRTKKPYVYLYIVLPMQLA
jgi:DNA polymerase-3 subunit beta